MKSIAAHQHETLHLVVSKACQLLQTFSWLFISMKDQIGTSASLSIYHFILTLWFQQLTTSSLYLCAAICEFFGLSTQGCPFSPRIRIIRSRHRHRLPETLTITNCGLSTDEQLNILLHGVLYELNFYIKVQHKSVVREIVFSVVQRYHS